MYKYQKGTGGNRRFLFKLEKEPEETPEKPAVPFSIVRKVPYGTGTVLVVRGSQYVYLSSTVACFTPKTCTVLVCMF